MAQWWNKANAPRWLISYPDGTVRVVPLISGGVNSNIAIDEPSTIDKRVDTEQVDIGGVLVERERMQIAGVSSGAIAPVSSADGLLVQISSGSTFPVSSVTIQGGQSTAIISTASAIRIESTVGFDSTVTLAAGSSIAVTQTAGTTFVVTGTSNVIISGNSTAIISTVSAIRIDSTGTLAVTGTSNVLLTTASTVRVIISDGQSSVSISGGQSSAIISTASKIRIESTVGFDSTVTLAAGSTMAVTQTAGTTFQVTGTSNVSGSTVSISTGQVAAMQQTDQVAAGSSAITVSHANISLTSSGVATIVSSGANQRIRVLGWNLVCATTQVVTWFSDSSAGTTLAGPYPFAANGGISVPVTPLGWFQTSAGVGVDLVLKLEVAGNVGGSVTYIQSSAI